MIVDVDRAEALPEAGRYDLCIAGGGVAGLVLAKTMAERGRRVLVLEAGGLDYSSRSQDVYRGDCIGRQYFDLATARLRYLGGTSNHWNGWCRPLDEYDFRKRDYISESGWPIGQDDLQPYLSAAQEILEIEDFPADETLPMQEIKRIAFRFSPPVRFKEKYLSLLESSENLDVYVNANLVRMNLDPDSSRLSAFVFRGYRDDASDHEVAADRYVLAMGGIENARALLNANHRRPAGLGNEADLVGRFFMEHPHHVIGWYIADSERSPIGKEELYFAPTFALMEQQQVANCGLRFEPMGEVQERSLTTQAKEMAKGLICASDVVADFVRTVGNFFCPRPPEAGRLRAAAEQVPNRNSRVRLIDDTDQFGLRRIALDWHLSAMDKKTMREIGMAAGRYLAQQDIGRVKLYHWLFDEDDFVPGLEDNQELAGFHHLGTTRMASSKDDGVVDAHCRVFGVDNLYIAGSSVFRTGGHANPTLTIVQLTLRLADHLTRA